MAGNQLLGYMTMDAILGETLLAEIFSRLPFEERCTTVPLVCKAWRDASYQPACWRVVDMRPWFQKRIENDFMWEYEPDECEPTMNYLVESIVDRSCGQLRELHTMHVGDDAIDHIAENCPSLVILTIPDSVFVTDRSAKKLSESCRKLQRLDISDCYNITKDSIEGFAKNCKSLSRFDRNMVRKDELLPGVDLNSTEQADEVAKIIAEYMGGSLKHLEMKKARLSDAGLLAVGRSCRQLESLNLACCTALTAFAIAEVGKLCPRLHQFVKPIIPRMHVNNKFLPVLFD